MAIYEITLEKTQLNPQNQSIYWSNVYHCNAADLASAQSIANTVFTAERNIHAPAVTFTKFRVRPAVVGAQGAITTLNTAGTRTGVSGDYLPLYNTLRVDFNTAVGRPSRKYLRLPIFESDQSNGQLVAATMTQINTNYVTPIQSLTGLCDVDGEAFVSVVARSEVQMRQLRRGSKRKTPVLP